MTPNLVLVGPHIDAQADCAAVLRSLPDVGPGCDEALLRYARDSACMPTFAFARCTRIVAFLTLAERPAQAWEVHCVAVHPEYRGIGLGRRLFEHVECWLADQGVTMLRVEAFAPALAACPPTRGFCAHLGYRPLDADAPRPGSARRGVPMVKRLVTGGDADEAGLTRSTAPGSR